MGLVVWVNSSDPKGERDPSRWYGIYHARGRFTTLTTTRYGVNFKLKISVRGKQFKPGLVAQNIAISMNGIMAVTFTQWAEITAVINEAVDMIKLKSPSGKQRQRKLRMEQQSEQSE